MQNPWMILLLLGSLFISACQSDSSPPDVSEIEIHWNWHRYDQKLFEVDSSMNGEEFQAWMDEHPAFTSLYVNTILGVRQKAPVGVKNELSKITASAPILALRDSVSQNYNEIEDLKKDMHHAFQFYKYYFPHTIPPNVYSCITEFSVGNFIFQQEDGRDAVGISLDFFLGNSFPYEQLGRTTTTFSNYLIRTFNKDHLIKKTMEVILQDQNPGRKDDRLLDRMIENGKTLYALKKVLPNTPDTVIFEFTPAQLSWCQTNEMNIWAHLIDRDLLYSRKMSEINTLIMPAPHSMGMPPGAPGRTGDYIGYRIVEGYAENTGAQLDEIFEEMDAQHILDISKYKGK